MIIRQEKLDQAFEYVNSLRRKEQNGTGEEEILDQAFEIEKHNYPAASAEQFEYLSGAENILLYRNHVTAGLSGEVEKNLRFLLQPDKLWMPSQRNEGPAEGLPDFSLPDWQDKIRTIQDNAEAVPDAFFVVLVGNMVTEEALPNYKTVLDKIAATGNLTGADGSPWARWSCGWTAEEDRHGNVLRDYLTYTGRTDMVEVDRSIFSLLRNGFDPRIGLDPYKLFIYTSFQERATRISHRNTGKVAGAYGDPLLERICTAISGDESRHEMFYKTMMGLVFDNDSHGATLAFEKLLRSQVVMPAELMEDGEPELYKHFSLLAQKERVYTSEDYAQIIEHLISTWNVDSRTVSGTARAAQEFICELPGRFRKTLIPRMERSLKKLAKRPYGWLFGRTA